MNSKLSNTFFNSFGFDVAVIIFTETWLKPHILNKEIFFPSYSIFRFDKDSYAAGVLIACRSLNFSEPLVLPDNILNYKIEFLAVRLIYCSNLFYITCSNITPNSSLGIYMQHSSNDSDQLIITGDFNLSSTKWT